MRIRAVLRWSPKERLYRVGSVIWRRGLGPGHGAPTNYDAMFTVALCLPWHIGFRRDLDGWRCWALGVRVHYARSYGGAII